MFDLLGQAIVLLFVIWFSVGVVVRSLATLEILFFFVPGNMFALLVSKGNESTDLEEGGGGLLDVAHEVPGMKLVCDRHNLKKSYFTPGVEKRGIFHMLYGVHLKGPFQDLRLNIDKSLQYGTETIEDGLNKQTSDASNPMKENRVLRKQTKSKFVWYSGTQVVQVDDADTVGAFRLDLKFTLNWQRKFPVLSMVQVADSNASLAADVSDKVNALTSGQEPEYFLSGGAGPKLDLVKAVESLRSNAETEYGLTISKVSLFSIEPDEREIAYRKAAQLKKITEDEQAARMQVIEMDRQKAIKDAEGRAVAIRIVSEAEKAQGLLQNDVQADRVKRVILPIASTPGGPAVRFAEAHERNQTLTTLSVGGEGGLGLIIPQDTKPRIVKP